MNFEYCTLDVFTERRFGGNPLPSCSMHAESTTRRCSRSRASSTTAKPPSCSRRRHGACRTVRIFTPGANCPSLPSHRRDAFALASSAASQRCARHRVRGRRGPGAVSIDRRADGSIDACTLTPRSHRVVETIEDRAGAAAMLGLARTRCRPDRVWSCGVPFLVVPLASVDALSAARLDLERWQCC